MAESEDRVYWGTLSITTDDNSLWVGDDPYNVVGNILDGSIPEGSLKDQPVSILGHMGQALLGIREVPTIFAKKVVLHKSIEQRAYQIYESGGGGSAFDNWLRAERELLQ